MMSHYLMFSEFYKYVERPSFPCILLLLKFEILQNKHEHLKIFLKVDAVEAIADHPPYHRRVEHQLRPASHVELNKNIE